MCRIFAFRSRVGLRVQRSLLRAENALRAQSREHPHGWGMAWYRDGLREPELYRSVESAFDDQRFVELAEVVSAGTVLAHVRKATVGGRTEENTHPFQYGPWTFCHNGTLQAFREVEQTLLSRVAPSLRASIRGTTDSELLFHLVLTELLALGVDLVHPPTELPEGLPQALHRLQADVAATCDRASVSEQPTMMNFVLTNGRAIIANRWNGSLHLSTQKARCADAERCPVADKLCFRPWRSGEARTHLLVASQPTSDDDLWEPLPERGVLLADGELRLRVEAFPT